MPHHASHQDAIAAANTKLMPVLDDAAGGDYASLAVEERLEEHLMAVAQVRGRECEAVRSALACVCLSWALAALRMAA